MNMNLRLPSTPSAGRVVNPMGEVKCASAIETGADFIISNDSSCLMQIQGLLDRQGEPMKSLRLAEVLASR